MLRLQRADAWSPVSNTARRHGAECWIARELSSTMSPKAPRRTRPRAMLAGSMPSLSPSFKCTATCVPCHAARVWGATLCQEGHLLQREFDVPRTSFSKALANEALNHGGLAGNRRNRDCTEMPIGKSVHIKSA